MKKNRKMWAAVLLIVLLAAMVLLLIQCGAAQEQQQSPEQTSSSGSSSSINSTSSMPGTSSSVQGTTVSSSSAVVTAPSSAPETKPTTQATKPTTRATKPSEPTTQQTKPATSVPGKTCNHSYGEWKWEEYTYTIDYGYTHPGGSQYATYTSHRISRTCTKCGFKETSGSDHICQKGSDNHTVTTVKAGTCTTKATMRSTCKVCGWYVEYEGKKGDHTVKTETRHLTDYGTYTNELDANVETCTSCGATDVTYMLGEGWSDYNRYRVPLNTNKGSAHAMTPITGDTALLDHPTWQSVRRDFVYDSEGYVKQYTQYWWYNGQRYSQVIKCGKVEIEAWFEEYGLVATSANSRYTIRIYGTEIRPSQISWSG